MPKLTSILDSLPPAARDQIIAWLETETTRAVLDRIAAPPPDGFGIQTHATTLRRFYARHRLENRSADLDLAGLISPAASADPARTASETLLSDWAFELATKPRRNVAAFKAISRWILKQNEHDQRRQELQLLEDRLALEREKFQFNAARQAIIHHAAINTVIANPGTDDEQKINSVRQHIFGAETSRDTSDSSAISASSAPSGSANETDKDQQKQ